MKRLEDHFADLAENYVSHFADMVIAEMAAKGALGVVDVVHELSAKLPVAAICEMAGVPQADWEQIFHWTETLVGAGDPEFRRPGENREQTLRRSSGEWRRYNEALVAQRMRDGFGADLLRLALFGPLIRQVAVSRFARTLGTMLASGVPVLRAIEVSKSTLGNLTLVRVVEEAKEAIAQGESIAVTLRASGQFPPMMTHMIAVGERAGQLENMLFRVADTFDREVSHKLDKLTSTLEPLMLVGMGVAVAFVVFSILMPIMDMSQFSMG